MALLVNIEDPTIHIEIGEFETRRSCRTCMFKGGKFSKYALVSVVSSSNRKNLFQITSSENLLPFMQKNVTFTLGSEIYCRKTR